MKLLLLFVLAVSCVHFCYGATTYELSEYFRIKHVVEDVGIQSQLRQSIPDSRKREILENYIGIAFYGKPHPNQNADTRPWKAILAVGSGTTLILSSPAEISQAIKDGVADGVDTDKNPVRKTKKEFDMIKIKVKIGKAGSGGSGPNQNIKLSFVNDGQPTVRREILMVGINNDGKINHFESSNKRG